MTKKSIVVEKEKEFVPANDDNGEPEGTVKQARKRKRVRKRKTCEKKKMAQPWLRGAPHYSPPLDDPGSTLLTSATLEAIEMLGLSPLLA